MSLISLFSLAVYNRPQRLSSDTGYNIGDVLKIVCATINNAPVVYRRRLTRYI